MNEKVKILYDKLIQGVEDVFLSERYLEFLKFSLNFRNYSFENTMLIFLQKPNATYVAGYKTWEKLGRYIKKGEKGIAIFAPLIKKYKETNKETGEEVELSKINGFRVVYVFDISQTDGKEIPSIVTHLSGDNSIELYNKLLELSPVPVNFDNLPVGKNGYYNLITQEIVISNKLTGNQRTKTLLHEVIHSFVEKETIKDDNDRRRAEIIAEGTTFVVANYFDLDTSDYSFGYLAEWSGNPKEIIKWGSEIQKTANFIIDKINNIKIKIAS